VFDRPDADDDTARIIGALWKKGQALSEAAVIDCRLLCGSHGSGSVDTLGFCPCVITDLT